VRQADDCAENDEAERPTERQLVEIPRDAPLRGSEIERPEHGLNKDGIRAD
jgi:hypothetical protein